MLALVLKAIGLAMGVAVIVLSVLNAASMPTMVLLLESVLKFVVRAF